MSVSKLPTSAEFRRGSLPDTAVNLAYIASKQITPDDVVVQNIAGSASGNVSSYVEGVYYAGYAGILQGGAKITDRNLYVTDKFLNGDLEKPLFFIAKSRYYHLGWPIYATGDICGFTNVSLLNSDGSPYTGNYYITVEPYEDYVSNGLPYPWTATTPSVEISEIPYRIIVYVDTDEVLRLSYNKIDSDLTNEDFSYDESLNPYPYFEEDSLSAVAQAITDENKFFVDDKGDEYIVSVPACQITDNRRFEYFYWRVKGILGSNLPLTVTVNQTPVEYPDLITPSSSTWQDITTTSSTSGSTGSGGTVGQPGWGTKTYNYVNNSASIGIGILDCGQGYDARRQPFLYDLEVSQYNKLGTTFINPAKGSYTTSERQAGDYWRVTLEDIDTDEKLDRYNILIIPVVRGLFEYNNRLVEWSKKSFKGLIFMFDYSANPDDPPNISSNYGVFWNEDLEVDMDTVTVDDDSDIITGACSVWPIAESPTLDACRNPYDSDGDIFNYGPGLTCMVDSVNYQTYQSALNAMTDTSPASECSVAGLYDHRIMMMDPYSLISIMGTAIILPMSVSDPDYDHEEDGHYNRRIEGHGEEDEDGSGFHYLETNHNQPEYYGHSDGHNETDYNTRVTYGQNGMKFLYNAIIQLSRTSKAVTAPDGGGGTTTTNTNVTVTTTTTTTTTTDYTPPDLNVPPQVITIEYNTPYVRSWITTRGSLSASEIADDDNLVVIQGRLMRKLLTGNPQNILQSYVASHYPIDFLALGDLGAEIEIDNPRVTLYQEGNNYYVYTDTVGGLPFEAGVSYPTNWIRSDHWTSRQRLTGSAINTDLYSKSTKTVQSTYTEKQAVVTPTKGVRQVPVVVPSTNPVYATHTPSWYIKTVVSSGGGGGSSPQTVRYEGIGAKSTPTSGGDVARITSGNVTFKIKSKEMEESKSTAYAWVYVPQCDKLLKEGSTGSDVSFWQTVLKNLGYYSGAIDGKYGPITGDAVLAFQTDHDEILEDRIIGPETGGRLADEAAQAGKFLPNHYQYVSTNNLLESSSGQYGRRTNPYGTVYQQPNLQDYVEVHFSSPVSINRIVIQPCGGPTNNPYKVTRVTMHTSGGRVYDTSPNASSSSTISIACDKLYEDIEYLYVHVLASQKWMSSTADAYYWGMQFIQAYGPGTATSSSQSVTYPGSVTTTEGETVRITLPTDAGSGATYTWTDCDITSGQATIQVVGGTNNTQWDITDTRTGAGGTGGSSTTYTGATDSTTIRSCDGVKTFPPKIPSNATSSQTGILVTNTDASTIVEFWDGSQFKGKSASIASLTSGRLSVGVKATDAPKTGGDTTKYVNEEYWYDVTTYVDVVKTRNDIVECFTSSGHIVIEGQDPPPAFYAYKPYAVRQHDGRMNVKLFYPDVGLTHIDEWLPKISFGSFSRLVDMSGATYGWQGLYSGNTLEAFYSVPELDWSDYGEFTTEHVDERLQFYGPREVRTKCSPLLFNEDLDGRTDISISVNGTPLSDSDIVDISKDGIITLLDTISSSDLVVGTYVVKDKYKPILGLNLNPYPGHTLTVDGRDYSTYQKIGLPVYVYLLPSFCMVNNSEGCVSQMGGVTNEANVISDSVEDNVVCYTTDPTIFDTNSAYYNRLAILIGIVSCTAPVEPSDITILDSRSRGGGAEDVEDTDMFDVDYFVDKSYPEKGFLIIEASLNDKSREPELIKAIENNIASGTIYKIRWQGHCTKYIYEVQSASARLISPTVETT